MTAKEKIKYMLIKQVIMDNYDEHGGSYDPYDIEVRANAVMKDITILSGLGYGDGIDIEKFNKELKELIGE